MKAGKRSKLISTSQLQLQDVPELLHRIQSLLPPEEATRTCVLSKLWLHAWSTIPTLRFTKVPQEQEETMYMKLIDHPLIRYNRDNIPIESLDLFLSIKNREYVSLVEKWINSTSSNFCVKEISLRI